MQFMILIKANRQSEAAETPTDEGFAAMHEYGEKMTKAGMVVLGGGGLAPSAVGWRVKFDGAKKSVVDGPFAETKDLIAGYSLFQANSREEAIEWTRQFPNPSVDGGSAEIEVRQIYEMEDDDSIPPMDRFRGMFSKMREAIKAKKK